MSPDDEDIPQLDMDDLLLRVGEWVDFTHSIALRRPRDFNASEAHKKIDQAYDLIYEAKTQIEIEIEMETERER